MAPRQVLQSLTRVLLQGSFSLLPLQLRSDVLDHEIGMRFPSS